MNIAILTFDGFNELDSIVAFGILNRMKEHGFNVQITSPTKTVTSMNGLTIEAQQQLEFANSADVVLFGSGLKTRDIAKEEHPQGLKENLNVAKRGGGVAKGAKDLYEKETKKSAISKNNSLNYEYIDEKLLED